ncbi:hypothetical protein GR927_04730 [Mycolicibacterium sp. 3033]|nr:hypothetical protein [Mycolicibacterium aurantiacum]
MATDPSIDRHSTSRVSGDALALLLGPEAADVLSAALIGLGSELTDLRLAEVRVQPGGAVRARYAVQVRRADGSRTREAFVAAAGAPMPVGAAVLAGLYRGGPVELSVWRWSQDPALPALSICQAPAAVAALLSDFGLPISATPDLTVRAYRPAQRAVLEVDDGVRRYFLKVVRPEAVRELCARHDVLSARLPVPPVLGHRPEGVVLLPQAPGTVLRNRLAENSDGAGPPPDPADLEALLDGLPAELLELRPVRSVLQRVRGSVEVIRACAVADPAVPSAAAAELSSAADRIGDVVLSATPQPSRIPVPAHGDFYPSQVLVRGGRISALVDVDTVGPGERLDEWATMLGHLSVLGLRYRRADDYCACVFDHVKRHVDQDELRRRTAAVVLGLALGPFRSRMPDWPIRATERLALAQHWLSGVLR